jgi:hypothetical protein
MFGFSSSTFQGSVTSYPYQGSFNPNLGGGIEGVWEGYGWPGSSGGMQAFALLAGLQENVDGGLDEINLALSLTNGYGTLLTDIAPVPVGSSLASPATFNCKDTGMEIFAVEIGGADDSPVLCPAPSVDWVTTCGRGLSSTVDVVAVEPDAGYGVLLAFGEVCSWNGNELSGCLYMAP